MSRITISIMTFFLVSFAQADEKDWIKEAKEQESKERTWMLKGQEAVKTQLKDPRSAQFQGVYFNRGADNIPMTCGEVNSKNSFGAYGGFQRFISAGKPELTFLQENIDEFPELWRRFCQ